MKLILVAMFFMLTAVSWGASYKIGCISHGVELNRSAEEIESLCKP